jgi:antitoxin (DNA-binding transcriptional repressor) of toxin-antitoxin stability system
MVKRIDVSALSLDLIHQIYRALRDGEPISIVDDGIEIATIVPGETHGRGRRLADSGQPIFGQLPLPPAIRPKPGPTSLELLMESRGRR